MEMPSLIGKLGQCCAQRPCFHCTAIERRAEVRLCSVYADEYVCVVKSNDESCLLAGTHTSQLCSILVKHGHSIV